MADYIPAYVAHIPRLKAHLSRFQTKEEQICIDLAHRPRFTVPKLYGSRPGYRSVRQRDVYPFRFLILKPSDPRTPFPSPVPVDSETW